METTVAKLAEQKANLEKILGVLEKYDKLFSDDGFSDTPEQQKIQTLKESAQQAMTKLDELEQERTKTGTDDGPREDSTSIDGVVPEGTTFNNAQEINVTDVTRLFNEDKSVIDEYGDGISHDDVNQNWINDCFFLSALAAVAKANPAAIKNLVSGPMSDGSYEVKLYIKGQKIVMDGNPTIVKVFPKALEKAGQTTVGLGDNELWVLLVERAFAQAMGGYDVLDEAGFTEHGLEAITGQDAVYKKTTSMTDEELVAFVQECITKKIPITASARAVKPDLEAAALQANIFLAHAYYVMGASGNTIQLRNPHNSDLPGGREVELSIADFKKFFDYVDYTAFEETT